jgi:hypothetical protein
MPWKASTLVGRLAGSTVFPTATLLGPVSVVPSKVHHPPLVLYSESMILMTVDEPEESEYADFPLIVVEDGTVIVQPLVVAASQVRLRDQPGSWRGGSDSVTPAAFLSVMEAPLSSVGLTV